MIGQLKYKGIHSSIFDAYFKSIKRPLLPQMRSKSVVIDGVSGIYDFGQNHHDTVKISGRIAYIATNPIQRKQKSREIASWLSSNKWEKLILGDEPDKYYLARIHEQVDLDALISSGEANITFECQPFAYMITNTGADLTWKEADFPWITTIPWNMVKSYQFNATGLTNFNFANPGTKETDISSPQGSKSLIKINGSWTTLNISLNDKTLQYIEPGTGELIIDNVEMEVSLNGINKFSVIDGDIDSFLSIVPGENTISVSGTGLNITVTIDFIPMWL